MMSYYDDVIEESSVTNDVGMFTRIFSYTFNTVQLACMGVWNTVAWCLSSAVMSYHDDVIAEVPEPTATNDVGMFTRIFSYTFNAVQLACMGVWNTIAWCLSFALYLGEFTGHIILGLCQWILHQISTCLFAILNVILGILGSMWDVLLQIGGGLYSEVSLWVTLLWRLCVSSGFRLTYWSWYPIHVFDHVTYIVKPLPEHMIDTITHGVRSLSLGVWNYLVICASYVGTVLDIVWTSCVQAFWALMSYVTNSANICLEGSTTMATVLQNAFINVFNIFSDLFVAFFNMLVNIFTFVISESYLTLLCIWDIFAYFVTMIVTFCAQTLSYAISILCLPFLVLCYVISWCSSFVVYVLEFLVYKTINLSMLIVNSLPQIGYDLFNILYGFCYFIVFVTVKMIIHLLTYIFSTMWMIMTLIFETILLIVYYMLYPVTFASKLMCDVTLYCFKTSIEYVLAIKDFSSPVWHPILAPAYVVYDYLSLFADKCLYYISVIFNYLTGYCNVIFGYFVDCAKFVYAKLSELCPDLSFVFDGFDTCRYFITDYFYIIGSYVSNLFSSVKSSVMDKFDFYIANSLGSYFKICLQYVSYIISAVFNCVSDNCIYCLNALKSSAYSVICIPVNFVKLVNSLLTGSYSFDNSENSDLFVYIIWLMSISFILLTVIFVLRNSKIKFNILNHCHFVKDTDHPVPTEEETQETSETLDPDVKSDNRPEDVISELQEELNNEKEEKRCVVCLSSPKTVLLLPCRHLCMCDVCADILTNQLIRRRCPLCQSIIVQAINVYM